MTVKEKNQYIYSSTIQFFSRLQNEKYEMSRSYKFTAFFFFFFCTPFGGSSRKDRLIHTQKRQGGKQIMKLICILILCKILNYSLNSHFSHKAFSSPYAVLVRQLELHHISLWGRRRPFPFPLALINNQNPIKWALSQIWHQ